MDSLLIGTGGVSGWPDEGCRCASCMRARSSGLYRAPGRVLVDGILEIVPGRRSWPETWPSASPAHRIEQLPGGWDITGPDGGRLLLSAGPGQVPEPPRGCAPYDMALLDLLARPTQLGLLRWAGLVHQDTVVAALYTDHRISSEQELARRCALWRAAQAHDGQLISSPARGQASRGNRAGTGPASAACAGPHRTLIIGGARSGKSTEAELRLAAQPQVTYLAAGPYPAAARPAPDSWAGQDGEPDAEWAQRVAVHRARRPPWWQTVESLDMAGLLRRQDGAILIDGIGTWLAAVMDEAGMWAAEQPAGPVRDAHPGTARQDSAQVVRARIDDLVDAWRQTSALVVAVTDQVGSGLVPASSAGRVFRDQLGWLNQRLAAESELNLLVMAGRVVTLPG